VLGEGFSPQNAINAAYIMKLRCETQVDAPEETVMADQDCGGTHRGPY